ncbi:MAG: M23 family metallopeptidase, partial [Oscillospiraceae bacterium]|nr:M23 family metallopeptidase [Oscillospiraceae bacterium]
IFAFADGHVAASGVSETAGKYLIISHGNGWTTQYFHCSEVLATGGSRVERGQVVAAVGQTGAATGPHLHFELIRDGVYHDPGLYLDEQG